MGVLEGLKTGKSTLVGPVVGALVGDLVGPLVVPLVDPSRFAFACSVRRPVWPASDQRCANGVGRKRAQMALTRV